MNRGLVVALLFSAAVNVGLVSAGVLHWAEAHRDARPAVEAWRGAPHERPGWARRGEGFGRGEGMAPGRGAERMFARWPERRIERMSRQLGLRPEQRARLDALLGGLRGDITAAAGELARARYQLADLLAQDAVDSARVREALGRANAAQVRLDDLVGEAMLRETGVLDPEQRRRQLELQWTAERD